MFNFKLVLIAILLILSCAFVHSQEEIVGNDDEFVREKRAEPYFPPCKPPPRPSSSGSGSSSTSSSSTPTPTRSPSTPAPTPVPTAAPTRRPSTPAPTPVPTAAPTRRPSTPAPTPVPTAAPTRRPSSTSTSSSSSSGSSSGSSTVGLCDIVPASQEPVKLLVPLYVYPGSTWDQLVSAASKVDIIAIINPNSGPTSKPDSSYTSGMNKLKNANIEMVGYVYTSYASRSLSAVKADIDTYANNFPNLKGIFFDEASNKAGDIPFYRELYNYVKNKGYYHVILNPGVQPDQGYMDVSTNIVIFEDYGTSVNSKSYSSWVKCAPTQAQKAGYKYRFSGIAHTTSQSNMASYINTFHNKGMGLVYITDGAGGCCTYNNLVSYFAAQASAVQSLNNS